MADIVLDVPLAYVMLDRFVERCSHAGFLSDKTIRNMPTRYVNSNLILISIFCIGAFRNTILSIHLHSKIHLFNDVFSFFFFI